MVRKRRTENILLGPRVIFDNKFGGLWSIRSSLLEKLFCCVWLLSRIWDGTGCGWITASFNAY